VADVTTIARELRQAYALRQTTTQPSTGEGWLDLDAVEWIAFGFEVIDCVYPDWTFTPADFVAGYGLHAALVVGTPVAVDAVGIPALCLGELTSAVSRRAGAEPLAAGDLVSSGTLTESQPIAVGQAWSAVVGGLDVPSLTATLMA
jgi:2-keto-4-pentenoate hydratase